MVPCESLSSPANPLRGSGVSDRSRCGAVRMEEGGGRREEGGGRKEEGGRRREEGGGRKERRREEEGGGGRRREEEGGGGRRREEGRERERARFLRFVRSCVYLTQLLRFLSEIVWDLVFLGLRGT